MTDLATDATTADDTLAIVRLPWYRQPLVLGLAAVLVVALTVALVVRPWAVDAAPPAVAAEATITLAGLEDGAVLSTDALVDLEVVASVPAEHVQAVAVQIDGEPAVRRHLVVGPDAVTVPGTILLDLEDGEHTLAFLLTLDDGSGRVVQEEVSFVVDRTPPVLTLPEVVEAAGLRTPLVLRLDDVEGATVAADGATVDQADGATTLTWATAPPAVVVTATDDAGNTATAEAPVVVPFPGGRAVHTTPSAWRFAPKREPIIALLEAGLIDAVQMDVKDELGDVSWDTDIAWADASGAEEFNRNFDMAAAIETIHSYGARVIGRLTVYRDHRLAQWAWENGRADLVVQATDGMPYAGRYGEYAFTNFAHPEVQQYNLDIALEAADLGFDDILYDYIRRPDGAIEKLVIPGLGDRTPEEAVVEVMATAYPLLRERGVWVGASVFGIAIDRPTQMAQDIPMMAEHVDYIAPMVYPNHWNLGEYDVPVPEDAPYDIVERSLTLYREVLEPTGTALMPWLQDFGGYGEAEVRAQIDATEAVTGERSFLLWASSATYTHAALDPIPGMPVRR